MISRIISENVNIICTYILYYMYFTNLIEFQMRKIIKLMLSLYFSKSFNCAIYMNMPGAETLVLFRIRVPQNGSYLVKVLVILSFSSSKLLWVPENLVTFLTKIFRGRTSTSQPPSFEFITAFHDLFSWIQFLTFFFIHIFRGDRNHHPCYPKFLQ